MVSASPAPPRNMPITGRSSRRRLAQRNQLARDGIAAQIVARANAISRSSVSIGSPRAPRSSAIRLVLPLGRTATGGGAIAEMAAVVELGQRRLHRAVAAIDRQHFRAHPGDRSSSPRRSGWHARLRNGKYRGARRNRRGSAAAGRCCRSISGFDSKAIRPPHHRPGRRSMRAPKPAANRAAAFAIMTRPFST